MQPQTSVLRGIRVAAAVTNVPGPIAAASLAAKGASVTKIEPPGGDPLEAVAPRWYACLIEDLRVLRLDLKCAQATVLSELSQCDILITAMRARSLRAAGLSWESLHERFPRLSHIAIVGEAAPDDDKPGHDLTYQAAAGLLSPPAMPRAVFADMFAAERAVQAALLALYLRERDGVGTHHEIPIAAGAADLSASAACGLTSPGGALSGVSPEYALYRTADGWIALAALEAHFRKAVMAALDVPELSRELLSARFAERTNAYWEELARGADLPIEAVKTLS